jgi:hypothetical protein
MKTYRDRHRRRDFLKQTLEDGSTKRVSTNGGADYRYPHGEAAPC